MRIGFGYDIHRLVEGRRLFLGGVEIPYIKGLLGHSDGDALLHAICDGLLGAIGAGDIGKLFPEYDPAYGGISSSELLKRVLKLVKQNKYEIINIDTIIIADKPRLEPFKMQMSRKIAEVLKLEDSCVNIKATTNEGIGEIGKAEAIAAYAVVLLKKGG